MSQRKKGKRAFRGHVKTSPGAACPRQVEIQDRRAFIASLGGMMLGGVMLGCSDDGKGAATQPDAGLPDLNAGIIIDAKAPVDERTYPWDVSVGWPDIDPAPGDLTDLFPHPDGAQIGGAPLVPDAAADQHPAAPEIGLAGKAPMPDASADMHPDMHVGRAGVPRMLDASADKKP